ncbi:hypothetical protein F5B20DRAFT_211464 [Whalleya microplaca]|nr:hypothetical protein F5B20DRAFT_211464 [Whalleya microplaca]
MRQLWGFPGCVRFIWWTFLICETAANYHDQYQIHQLQKNHDIQQHPKRDATCQLSGWFLCPASANGGCCPNDYACDVSSCYATTAGPTTACGRAGYYGCGLQAAGVCCPVGMICPSDGGDCLPPEGVSSSQSCPTSYFGCASSLGYGCCRSGLVCGSGACYETTPTTLPVSSTVTITDSKGNTITTTVTSMAVITPGLDTATMSSTDPAAAAVPKLIPSTVAKIPSIETGRSDDSAGGGLTASQLGGIIGGVVALLVTIIVAAVIIIRRLRRTEKAAQAAAESRHESSNGQSRSHKPGFGQPSVSEVAMNSIKSSDIRPSHYRGRSDSSTDGRSPSRTPNLHGSGTSSPPPWPGYYNPTPPSDGRQSSQDSHGGHHENAQQAAMRVSVDTQATYTHSRQHSNSSEVSGSADGAHGLSELDSLDTSEAARRRSSSATRPPKAQVRRSSDHSRARGDSTAAAAALGTVNEIAELHGYYGSPSLAVGQTAARLTRPNSARSSAPENNP